LRSSSSAGIQPERERLNLSGKGFLLMPLIYKSHTIVAGAARSQSSQSYIPVAYIGWEIAGERGSQSLIMRERFPTFEKASNFALGNAQVWVDQHAAELN
jgi:hypothetical protein